MIVFSLNLSGNGKTIGYKGISENLIPLDNEGLTENLIPIPSDKKGVGDFDIVDKIDEEIIKYNQRKGKKKSSSQKGFDLIF